MSIQNKSDAEAYGNPDAEVKIFGVPMEKVERPNETPKPVQRELTPQERKEQEAYTKRGYTDLVDPMTGAPCKSSFFDGFNKPGYVYDESRERYEQFVAEWLAQEPDIQIVNGITPEDIASYEEWRAAMRRAHRIEPINFKFTEADLSTLNKMTGNTVVVAHPVQKLQAEEDERRRFSDAHGYRERDFATAGAEIDEWNCGCAHDKSAAHSAETDPLYGIPIYERMKAERKKLQRAHRDARCSRLTFEHFAPWVLFGACVVIDIILFKTYNRWVGVFALLFTVWLAKLVMSDAVEEYHARLVQDEEQVDDK